MKYNLLFILLFVAVGLKAQLITDSQARLKTAKSDAGGFLGTQGKIKPKLQPSSIPRTRNPKVAKSSTGVISFGNTVRRPRYSSGIPLTGMSAPSPRYSKGMPLTGMSAPSPRYSKGMPLTGMRAPSPRYSKGMPLTGMRAPSPRYSKGIPNFDRYYGAVNRFSTKVTFPAFYYDSNNYGRSGKPDWGKARINPRYTGSEGFSMSFYLWIQSMNYANFQEYYYKDMNEQLAGFDMKYKLKPARGADLHPSYRYQHGAMVNSEILRAGMQKWNVLWNRMYGNNVQPEAVKKRNPKPKFDKDETEIWNN